MHMAFQEIITHESLARRFPLLLICINDLNRRFYPQMNEYLTAERLSISFVLMHRLAISALVQHKIFVNAFFIEQIQYEAGSMTYSVILSMLTRTEAIFVIN